MTNTSISSNALLLTATFELTISNIDVDGISDTTGDQPDHYTFTPMNGDNWFYFRDDYSGSALAQSANAPPCPFEIKTISATDNQVMFFNFTKVPNHKVLHSGACSFSGVETPTDSQARHHRGPRYTVPQVLLNAG